MLEIGYDAAHLLDGGVLLLSFALLYQRRLFAIFNAFSVQALLVAAAAAWQAHIQDAPHLYISAGIALVFKAIVIPLTLRRIVTRLGIHHTIDTVIGVGPAMIAAVALVALSILLVLPVTFAAGALTRETLAMALSVVLIGLLIMIKRPMRTTESAIARLSRVSAPAAKVTGRTKRIDSATRATAAIIAGP